MKFVSLYTILRCCIFTSCAILFLILMNDVWEKFDKKITTFGSKLRTETSDLFPCITFCPLPGFKSKGFFFTNRSYFDNTHDMKDLFADNTLKEFENTSVYHVKEMKTHYSGRCFTVCIVEKMGREDSKILNLKKNLNIRLYLHNRELIFRKTSNVNFMF